MITSDQLKSFKHFVIGTKRLTKEKYRDCMYKRFKDDIAKTWSVINNFIRPKQSKNKTIIDSISFNNQTFTSSQDISDTFNSYFT